METYKTMVKNKLLFLALIFILACGETRKNDTQHIQNIEIKYYENGNVLSRKTLKGDMLHGKYEFFFENGILAQTGNYYENQLMGIVKIFSEEGNLTNYKEYRIEKTRSILNQWKVLNKKQEVIIEESFFADVVLKDSIIYPKDSIYINISLYNKKEDQDTIWIKLMEADTLQSILLNKGNPSKYKTYYEGGQEDKIELTLSPKRKKGKNKLFGVINIAKKDSLDENILITIPIFFQLNYYVITD